MCYNPIRVKNPKIDFNAKYDKAFLYVPCGKCESCKNRKRSDILVRLYYSLLHYQSIGGCAHYITLTYSDDNLPYIFVNGRKRPCFCKKDIQKYIKRLRINLQRRLNITDTQYYVASEFGGTTHRPHYHMIFFHDNFAKSLAVNYFLNVEWQLGFTKLGNLSNGIVTSISALQYCSKYITKDVFTDDYFQKIAKTISREQLRYISPFSLYSKDLGFIGIRFVDSHLIESGFCKLPCNVGFNLVRSPRYFDLKLFYYKTLNCNGNIQYLPTDKGYDVLKKRVTLYKDVINNNIEVFFNYPNIPIDFITKNYHYETFNSFSDFKMSFFHKIDYNVEFFINYLVYLDGYHDVSSYEYDYDVPTNIVFDSRFSVNPHQNLQYMANHVPYDYILASYMLRVFNKYLGLHKQNTLIETDTIYQKIRSLYAE